MGSPFSNCKYSVRSPRSVVPAKPWDLCIPRARVPISKEDWPSSGMKPPICRTARESFDTALSRSFAHHEEVFQYKALGAYPPRRPIDWRRSKARMARTAEAVWWPWPARASGGKRVTITSGLNSFTTASMRASTSFSFHFSRVSSTVLEYPKSAAPPKYWVAPSKRRAA